MAATRKGKYECSAYINFYSRIARERSTVCFVHASLFGPMLHKKGQLKQPLVYLSVILQKLCVGNSEEIVDAYVT
jgi:hypothetical protein